MDVWIDWSVFHSHWPSCVTPLVIDIKRFTSSYRPRDEPWTKSKPSARQESFDCRPHGIRPASSFKLTDFFLSYFRIRTVCVAPIVSVDCPYRYATLLTNLRTFQTLLFSGSDNYLATIYFVSFNMRFRSISLFSFVLRTLFFSVYFALLFSFQHSHMPTSLADSKRHWALPYLHEYHGHRDQPDEREFQLMRHTEPSFQRWAGTSASTIARRVPPKAKPENLDSEVFPNVNETHPETYETSFFYYFWAAFFLRHHWLRIKTENRLFYNYHGLCCRYEVLFGRHLIGDWPNGNRNEDGSRWFDKYSNIFNGQ